jgi:hypothetical protein
MFSHLTILTSFLQTKIPNGRTTQFVLVSSGGVNLPLNTQGITDPNNEDSDVRCQLLPPHLLTSLRIIPFWFPKQM